MGYSRAAMERAMKVQDIILRAISKQMHWFQAAQILGVSPRQLRRLYERYQQFGYDGFYDRRTGQPSPKQLPLAVVEKVLALYREKYSDFSVKHFHEKLQEEHGITLSYTWVKLAAFLPIGETAEFRIVKDKMILRVPEANGKEKDYIVVSMTQRMERAEAKADRKAGN
jgi:transposase